MTSNILLQMGETSSWLGLQPLAFPSAVLLPWGLNLPFPSCRTGLEVDAVNAQARPSRHLPPGSGEQSYAFWEQGTEEAQGTSQGHRANRDISLKGRCLPCGDPMRQPAEG